jgi:tetratricopeptide (TPR) repeat protein
MNRDYVAARQKLQSALQIWGGNPWAKYYLGLVEFEEGNYSPAVTFAKAALRQLKRYPFWNARAFFLLGEAYGRLGRTDESTRAKDEAYELDPNVSLQ